MSRRAATSAALAAAASVALVGCAGRKTPPAPPKPPPPKIEALQSGGTPALQPYLDAYPLGDRDARIDLLAATSQRSLHLVQTRRGIARHRRPNRTETMYVLTGAGVCYVGDKSYPLTPGAAFHFAPGVVHSVTPQDGAVIVAVVYLEPPLVDGDDRVLVE